MQLFIKINFLIAFWVNTFQLTTIHFRLTIIHNNNTKIQDWFQIRSNNSIYCLLKCNERDFLFCCRTYSHRPTVLCPDCLFITYLSNCIGLAMSESVPLSLIWIPFDTVSNSLFIYSFPSLLLRINRNQIIKYLIWLTHYIINETLFTIVEQWVTHLYINIG